MEMKPFLYILIILLALLLLRILYVKYITSKQLKIFHSIFTNNKITLPLLKLSSSYGYPTFRIIFSKKEDMEYARTAKLFESFDDQIRKFYSSKYDTSLGISYTYIEQKTS